MTAREAPAVVLGAGMAGMLAAAALARHPEIGSVTVVDRDRLDDGPLPRRGLPQGRHAHVLMSSGVRAIEALLPGTTDRWLAAGAHRIGLPDGYVILLPQGWLPRWRGEQFVIACSRGLLDWVLRQQLLGLPGVRLLAGTEATGLCGDLRSVTGVRVRDVAGGGAGRDAPRDDVGRTIAGGGAGPGNAGAERVLDARFVVDATGRGSRAPHWLAALGAPPVAQEIVDSGLRYATRIFRAPAAAAAGFPVVNVQADPAQARPGQTAAIIPIEDGQWLVTLSGTRGGQPSPDEEEFVGFAAGMRHPVVAELIAPLEPLGPVAVSNSTANRRRRFELLPVHPDGFVALGDAVATYNPVYGHGMSVAAFGATVLAGELRRRGLAPGLAGAVQARVAATAAAAWAHATGTDVRFPGAAGPAPSRVERALWRYQGRLMRTALDRPSVAREVIEVLTLSAPASRLLRPRVALATLRGPRRPAVDDPPFTPAERAMLGRG